MNKASCLPCQGLLIGFDLTCHTNCRWIWWENECSLPQVVMNWVVYTHPPTLRVYNPTQYMPILCNECIQTERAVWQVLQLWTVPVRLVRKRRRVSYTSWRLPVLSRWPILLPTCGSPQCSSYYIGWDGREQEGGTAAFQVGKWSTTIV